MGRRLGDGDVEDEASPAELGAIIRERRRRLGLEQKALAEQARARGCLAIVAR